MPRPLLKTVTYSLMHLTVAIAVAYALTGNLALALGIGLIEPFFQTIAYTVHERIWEKWIPGCSAPVGSVHARAHTLVRIEEHERAAGGERIGKREPAPA